MNMDTICETLKKTVGHGPVVSTLLAIFVSLELLLTDIQVHASQEELTLESVVSTNELQDDNVEVKSCSDPEVCLWTQYCRTTFFYDNSTGVIRCQPCYSICKDQISTDDNCKKFCPNVWSALQNESITVDSLRNTPVWEARTRLAEWNIGTRFLTGILGAVAAALLVIAGKKGVEILEGKIGVKREDQEAILEEGGSRVGCILSDERIAIQSRQSSPPPNLAHPGAYGRLDEGVVLKPSSDLDGLTKEDTQLRRADKTPYGTVDSVTEAGSSTPGHM